MDIVNNTYNFLTTPMFILLVLFVSGIVLGVLMSYGVYRFLEKYTIFGKQQNLKLFLKHIRPILYLFSPILILNIILPIFGFQTGEYALLDGLMRALLVIAVAGLFIEAVNFSEDLLYQRFDINAEDNLKARKVRTQIQVIKKVLVGFVVVIAIALILMSFESARKIGAGLLTSAGILTAIVSFAAQNSLSNIWAGLQVAFTQPIRIDDVLIVENENGKVEEITLSHVVFKTWDKRRIILPISYFTQKPFQNWSYSTTDMIGTVFLYVDYSFPVDDLRQELKRILQNHPLWDKQVVALHVTEASENTMQLRAIMSARTSAEAFDLRCDVREKMIGFIKDRYPQCLPKGRVEQFNVNNFREGVTLSA